MNIDRIKKGNYKIVIASVRPADLLKWIAAWGWDKRKVIIVEDLPIKSELDIKFPNHYSHKEIDHILKKDSWIIPRKTSAIKSFGILEAYRQGADWIIVLDDDCYPVTTKEDFIEGHYKNLINKVDLNWIRTGSQYARGYPYDIRGSSEVVLSHGLWKMYPDYDAITALATPNLPFEGVDQIIPRWNFFPMCGMNIAFRSLISPLMYFGLQGISYPYDRFDDIWCGIFAKKVIDHLGYAVFSGEPSINHTKLSNLYVNLKKEAPGIHENELVWKAVQSVALEGSKVSETASDLFHKLPLDSDYWKLYRKSFLIWLGLFKKNKR